MNDLSRSIKVFNMTKEDKKKLKRLNLKNAELRNLEAQFLVMLSNSQTLCQIDFKDIKQQLINMQKELTDQTGILIDNALT